MTSEEISKYLINKGDIDGILTIKQIGNVIHHGYLFIEDQNDYSMSKNRWQFSMQGKSLFPLDGDSLISIEYQIN
jgi:hypothetical protein